ncbi:MFS transporter [Robertmurraya yapensis]|uniref:MFS transporter n=2 Tax=Bacillaceae TaxID=186817 RepID=A0A431W7S1_9BACI|nr:MFS transporter [Bacillus yapensis]RTR31404.1 MFS transporter [Bacillus yapensis]TKS95628.1 MFS transporter [Bacillus yapensis]
MKLREHTSFVRFWFASTTSNFGTYITTVALQVIVIVNMGGSAIDVGWVSASRWLPYVLLGLIAGVIIDLFHRKAIMVITDIGRGILLSFICLMAYTEVLSIGWLMFLLVLFGTMSLFNDAASQSFVPQLVPRTLLTRANARLEQSAAVAETSGPAIGGVLTQILSAPFALLVDAVTYLISGIFIASVKHQPTEKVKNGPLGYQIKEGLHWIYRHQHLGTLALNTHTWFLFHSMTTTVFVSFVLTEIGFDAALLGIVLGAAGVGAVAGTSLSVRIGEHFGAGRAISFSRNLYGPAVVLIALAPAAIDSNPQNIAFLLVIVGQFLYGFAMGIEGPLEMAYRQFVTPSHLQGRMNATLRSINRSFVVIGAPLGGLIADQLGSRTALSVSLIGLTLCGLWFSFSPMRHAQIAD